MFSRLSSGVKSARRVIEIFELFDRYQYPVSLTHLSDKLGYPPSSTLALLKSLQMLGYIAYDPGRKTYVPTMRVAMLGDWVRGQVLRNGVIVTLMTDLQVETDANVMLAIQNDLHTQYVHTVQSRKLLRYYIQPGLQRPICRSAAGLALLSQQSLEQIRKLLKRIATRSRDPHDLVPEDELFKMLEQIVQQGYVYSDQITDGVGTVAIALPTQPGQMHMALGVAGASRKIQPNAARIAAIMHRLVSEQLKN